MRSWLVWFVGLGLAFGHPASDGVGAAGELQFEAGDFPQATVPVFGWFDLKTPTGQAVQPGLCSCTLLIYAGEASAKAQPLLTQRLERSLSRLEYEFTFPQAGRYTVVLLGRPAPGSNLEPFQMTYIFWVLQAP